MIAKANKLQQNYEIKNRRKYHIQHSYYCRLDNKSKTLKKRVFFRIDFIIEWEAVIFILILVISQYKLKV